MSDRSPTPSGPAPQEPGGKPALPNPLAIATELWLVVVAGQAIAYAGQYPTASDSVREAARSASTGASADEVRMLTSTGTIVGVYVAVGVVLTLLSLLVVWMARSGRNWARLALMFFSAFIVAQTAVGLFGDAASSWTTIPAVLSGVAALGAAYLLVQRDTEKYCRAMAAHRRGGGPTTWGTTPPAGPTPPQQPPYPPQNPYPQNQYTQQHPPQNQYSQQNQYPPQQQYQYPPTQGPDQRSYPQQSPRYDPHARWEPARGENVRERGLGDRDDAPRADPTPDERSDRGE
ncbi:hypothetical protein [Williamsia deligens]|uniref:Uncharacterized protein n=1 Tax=Williamsia deligens TaxID=321325 RepID=A0ABW3G3S7_9NOCA|nr:hypothetical protein [Williamsia deligens]MCP2194442.1 hypothetical protein [Williamsia deligens]